MAYLEIVGLGKRFGETDVLHDVSLSLEQGQILSVIGPSGEGKTTFLRCLNFLETPDRGIIRLKGETLFDAARVKARGQKPRKRAFGLVFQAFHLFPQYTVLENVMLAPTLAKKGTKAELRERALDLIEKVGLREKANSYPNTLSGGQQQRAAIARALAMEPDVLCFDEPTSALDPLLTKEVLNVIRLLKDEGRTMIVVTHEMAFAREASDQVAFLNGGTVAELGTPQEVFGAPKTEALRRFLRQ
jgi:polar amino acid transport system ATP-binding protein